MKYTAKGVHNRHFELIDDKDLSLGKLDYAHWFSIKAEVQLSNGKVYTIAPTNIWQTAIEIQQDGITVASLKFNWKMQIIISMETGQTYSYMHKGFLNAHYGLFTEEEQEIVVIKQEFNLSKLSFNYNIETNDNYAYANDPLMLLLLTYCTNWMHSKRS